MKTQYYVIPTPFKGWIERATFDKDTPLKEGERLVTNEEFDKVYDDFCDSLITPPVEITPERWQEMLEILPPCRWHNVAGYSVFHISEHNYGDNVTWYALSSDETKAYQFDHRSNVSDNEIRELLKDL